MHILNKILSKKKSQEGMIVWSNKIRNQKPNQKSIVNSVNTSKMAYESFESDAPYAN